MSSFERAPTRIRFSVTEPSGIISFCGPCHTIKMLVAACANGAATADDLLERVATLDEQFVAAVVNGLTVFDEHNLADDTQAIEQLLQTLPPIEWPPFRVYNEVTRNASTQPAGAGLIIFNLPAKRIVQVQNSYADIQRKDRGRRRRAGRPIQILYHYELSNDWSIVP